MDETLARALVEMDVVQAVALRVEAAEDVDVAALPMRARQQPLQRRRRLGVVGAVHHVAVAPFAGVVEQVAAQEIERRQFPLPG